MHKHNIQYLTENKELIAKVQQFIFDWQTPKETIVTKTSGSTGTPKTISLLKKHMRASAQMSGKYFQFSSNQKIALSLSIDTIGGKMIIVRALEFKMTLVVLDVVKNPIKLLVDSIYFISLVPYQLQAILEETPEKLNFVENVLLGGAPVSQTLKNQLQFLTPNFYESYGMTETMSHVAIKNLKLQHNYFEGLENTFFSCCADELIIDAPELGIIQLQTKDQVQLVDNTKFVWLGRTDFAINSGGIKIHPEIIERKIEKVIPFRFFIHKEKDNLLGEIVVLLIEKSHSNPVKTELQDAIKLLLTNYEFPKKIYFIETFIETNSGKINRIETFKKVE